ncbi:hypothetical protein [Streptomyces sp. NBC_01373]|uniref:DUF7380 domain-containing protein n=1 Tax=Streptomyces sp. NBC_01373 TaxID=2903843 RepID=UPI0022505C8C|nr:hypothetical protein [Streptomyces sp. NBC_01373]MCX4698661.1 hypothetical protein [Streptomyces sp. NBC_01373]
MSEGDSVVSDSGLSDETRAAVDPLDPEVSVYRHDSSLVPALAELADAACEGSEDLPSVSLRIRRLAQETGTPFDAAALDVLTTTFTYHLAMRPFMSTQPGVSLVPLDGPSIFPVALRDADSDVRELWLSLYSSVTHPVAKARCADIVFTLRLKKGREAAEEAVRAYLCAIGGSLSVAEQGTGLLRAWDLTRSVNLSSMAQQVKTAMLDMAEGLLNDGEDGGTFAHLLDALSAPQRKKNVEPLDPRVDDLLDRALVSYSGTLVIRQIAPLVRRRAAVSGDDIRVRRASEVEVKAHLSDADRAVDGMVIRAHLNDAASLARRLNVPELESLAVSRLQSAPPVDWKTIRTEFNIPNAYIRGYLRPYKRVDTWRKALGVWFNSDSPSGSLASNEAVARSVLNRSVFARIATTVLFGPGDLPKRVISEDDEAFQHQLVGAETWGINLHGMLLADALDIIKDRFGIPVFADLEESILTSGTHPVSARALAKGLILYWVGEFDACVHLVVPKVETSVRALLLELNEPVYKTQVGDGAGQFPGLGSLLPCLMDNGFDPDWERFLRTFLLGDGMGVRNLVAHGFMDTVSREKAALALRAYSLLVLITPHESTERDAGLVKASLANPLGVPPRGWWQRIGRAARAARNEFLR